ncbi:MAG: outer membrane protein assembly factor BamE [Gemmataceae bacterium]|nr:outer membrane protein assembly factor BamE [Gemmataceae bacterium]
MARTTQSTRDVAIALAKYIGVPVVLLALFVGIGHYMWTDWVPKRIIDQLPGATRDQVRELLGEPTSTNDDRDGGGKWIYRPPSRLAEFQLWFGPDGTVQEWYYDR